MREAYDALGHEQDDEYTPEEERRAEERDLAANRDEALGLVEELENTAAALRRVIEGTADQFDLPAVRGQINGQGYLIVEQALDWDLLLRHAHDAEVPDAPR